MQAPLQLKSAMNATSTKREGTTFAIAFLLVVIVVIAPLTVIDLPLLADYPNHVARMHILGNVDRDFFLSERYDIRLTPLPNIAMDLIVPGLARLLPLDVAARVFLAACLLAPLVGVAGLHQVLFNRWSLHPLLAALFVFHGSMIAGMVNFSLGIGLVPAALALWIRLHSAPPLRRLLIGSALAIGLYFCHLVAFGAYGLLVIGYELGLLHADWRRPDRRRRALRDLGLAIATGALPVLLFLGLASTADQGQAAVGLVFGNVSWKMKALLAPLANYNLPLDLASFAVIAGLALIAWLSGRLQIHPTMAPALALLALAFALAPKALWTGGVFDQRLSTLLALMLVACTRFDAPEGLIGRLMPVLATLLLLVRIGVLTATWLAHRDDLAEMRQAIERVTEGSRILVARPDESAGQRLAPPRHRVFHHAVQLTSLPALAVIEKSAFVSTLYALPGQQPLALKPPFDRLGGRGHVDLPTLDDLRLAARDGRDPSTGRQISGWRRDFDYLVLIYGYGPGAEALAGGLPLEPLLDGEILDLYRIVKG